MNKAIGLMETTSIAGGIETADAMVKIAPVKLYISRPICPGKFMILIGGDVASVQSSVKKGRETVKQYLADSIIITNVHDDLFPAIEATAPIDNIKNLKALGVIETFTVASCIIAADAAAKAGGVILVELRPAMGLGGKAYVTMLGDVSSVESAVHAGKQKAEQEGLLVNSIVIPTISKDVLRTLI